MKPEYYIDINADVGEGVGNEADLMPYLSSCSIACGGHAGDESTMKAVVRLAKQHDVKIGAHPSFPDKVNFGRSVMKMTNEDLYTSILDQILKLKHITEAEGMEINHVKPHGALYNLIAKDATKAKVVISVLKNLDKPIKLYAPFNSVISKLAKLEDVDVVFEAFADRNYNDDLSLVSRKSKTAILHEKVAVLDHVLQMIKHKKVKTINGVEVHIKASTFCVHGDTNNATEILKYLSKNLSKKNIAIQ